MRLDSLGPEPFNGVRDGFRRPLDIGPDDDPEVLDCTFRHLREQVVQRHLAHGSRAGGPLLLEPGLGDLAGDPLIPGHHKLVAGHRHPQQAHHLRRDRRPGLLDRPARIVEERTDAPAEGADDERIAGAQRARLHEHGGDRAAPPIEFGLDHGALRQPCGIDAQFQDFCLQQNHLQQGVQAGFLLGRHLDVDGVSAPRLGDESAFRQ